MCLYMCAHGSKKMLVLLELDLQAAMTHPVWILKANSGTVKEKQALLATESSLCSCSLLLVLPAYIIFCGIICSLYKSIQ